MRTKLPRSYHKDPRVRQRVGRRTFRSWLWQVFISAFAVILAVIAGFAGWLYTGLPITSGRQTLATLSHEVGVYRDEDGVPHIFARQPADAWRALGFVHAQDRLAQMELMRRLATGRLAEVAGSSALKSDIFMRRLGLSQRVQKDFTGLKADTRAALEAYAEGVNGWLSTRGGAWPVEFYAMGGGMRPWQPHDSLLWGKLMALSLTGNWRDEALRLKLLAAGLTPEQLRFLYDTVPGPITLPNLDVASLNGLLNRTLAAIPDAAEPRTASNIWALAGSHTDSGKPRLANDPHLTLTTPSLWYLARIVTPGMTLTGATVPGVPFHILGQNGSIAWGMTTTGADMQDLVIERLSEGRDDSYDTPDGPQVFRERTERIRVRGSKTVTLKVRETHNGPVISDDDSDLQPLPREGHVLVLKAAYLQDNDTSADALADIGKAANWSEFRAALGNFVAPMQNFAAAAKDGTIGMISAARLPIRRDHDGWLPSEGWTGKGDWIASVPLDQLPQRTMPDNGTLANANNRLVDDRYSHLITRDWDEPFRAQALEEALTDTANRPIEADTSLQHDNLSPFAEALLPILLPLTDRSSTNTKALDLLSRWNYRMERTAAEPLIFSAWARRLMEGVFSDELRDVEHQPWQPRYSALLRTFLDSQVWCDDITTADRQESCKQIATRALDLALADISDRYGADMSRWQWGKAHQAVNEHPIFGRIPVLKDIFNLSIDSDGSFDTLNRATFRGRAGDDFSTRHGAGYRAVYDLSDPEQSRFMISTGQSGNILSDHYSDLLRRWRDGKHRTITGSPADLIRQGAKVLTLTPS